MERLDGPPAYVEFRVGAYQHELGIIDRRYAPPSEPTGRGARSPTGTSTTWRPRSSAALSLGATEHQPPTDRGDSGFRTASVVDPFGNLLGLMRNPHYLDVLDQH